MRKIILLASMLFGSSLCGGAEVYPNKPVRVVVASAAGSSSDATARLLSQQLTEQLGTSFVVENRTGASGMIGYGSVAKSAPDGYTVMMAESNFAIVPSLFKAVPYDTIKDFTPITEILRIPVVLVVQPSLNVRTLKEFVALAQANPGKFNYGSGGPGSALYLYTELFKIAAKVNLVNVSYKGGGGETIAALLGDQIQLSIITIPAVLAQIKGGKLRALAVTTDGKRAPSLPDVPSMSEAGVSGMAVYTWHGWAGPAGMSREIVNKLQTEVARAIAVPSVREKFSAQGAELVGGTSEEFSRLVRTEVQRWAEVVKSTGITPE